MQSARERVDAYFTNLLSAVPEFQETFDDIVEYYEEVHPVLMHADLARFLVATARRALDNDNAKVEADSICRRASAFLDFHLDCGDKDYHDWIYSGFLEGLLLVDESAVAYIVGSFDPRLKEAWKTNFS